MGILEFEVGQREADRKKNADPVQFALVSKADGRREVFTICEDPPLVPLMAVLALAEDGDQTPDGQISAAAAIYRFLMSVVIEADRGRFERACTRFRLDGDDLYPVVVGLTREVYARPTVPSSASGGSSSTGTPSSTAAAPSEEPTTQFS